jgi:non-heme chloroperoxidase
MGCAVIWSYIDLFGLDRLRKLVLVDCEPWSIDLLDNRGHGVVTPADAGELTSRIDEGWDVDREPLLTGFVGDASERTYGMSAAWAARLPAGPAARLAFSFLSSDWRDVIPRISVPTLVIGAGNGGVPQAAVDWVAENLPDGSLVRLDNVSHMVMLEAPERFTGAVTQFLNRDATPAASASASVRAG